MPQFSAGNGLIQTISDNFNASINTQNGIKQTNAMATIVTQTQKTLEGKSDRPDIPRLKQEDTSKVKLTQPKISYFKGVKNPPMPKEFSLNQPLPLLVFCKQVILRERANHEDFQFIKSILLNDSSPDFNGYNTKHIRTRGESLKPKTKVVFMPLLDRTPSDPSTVLTTMIEAERITNNAGQSITVFTADQQLYRVVLDVIWTDPERFSNFVPRIGGMHWVMSFIGSIGILMQNSGLLPWLKSAFGGVEKMLLGKKFPMNVRALRYAMLEIMRGHVEHLDSFVSFNEFLESFFKEEKENEEEENKLAKHWVVNFIKPMLLILLYIRAEREGDFSLHLYACHKMMPYFFASGHINYARYGICYLRTLHKLPKCILEAFLRGEHVMRHQDGIWNGIWSDMMIETTYMRYGKGPGGIIGVTTQPRTVQIWTESLPACTEVLKELDEVREKNSKVKSSHKEESDTRITNDLKDRIKLRDALQLCAHPFDPIESNGQNLLINIYTGEIAPEECNVQRSLEIGSKQLSNFVSRLPDGFYSTIQKKVITMAYKPKRKESNEHETYNTEMLYSRVMCLLSVNQISLDDLFKYELSPIPLSMFKVTGEGRFPSNKSSLKNKLKVEVSKRNIKTDAVILDFPL